MRTHLKTLEAFPKWLKTIKTARIVPGNFATSNVRGYRTSRSTKGGKGGMKEGSRYEAASRSHDAAVILNETHVSGPPTSWSSLIIYTSISSVFDVPPSGSRHSPRQKFENRGRSWDSRLERVLRDYRGPPPCHSPPHTLFLQPGTEWRRCVSGSTNWS